jgi:ABC-type polysaccharide/polyol phosphate export permease
MVLFTHWELIKHLTLREVRARYKQSFLGFFWIILNPFFQMLIMSFVFSQIIKTTTLGAPYPLFVFVGLLTWTLFANSVTSATSVLVDNAALIKKIYFPREVLVLSTLLAKTVDFFIAAIIFLLMMWFFHMPFTWYMLLFLPIFLVQFLFTLGLSLFLSAVNLLYRDVQYLFTLIMTLWFYVTPIVYSVDFFPPQYRWIFKFNPMAVFINAYRQVLLGGDVFSLSSIIIGVVVSLVIFIFSYILFKRLEGIVADVV